MSKGIRNYNSKGQVHGYQEWYWWNSKLWYKCFYNNDVPIDYEEVHRLGDGGLLQKRFYI